MRPPGIIETVKYSYGFVSEHRRHFFDIVFPLLPFLYASEVTATASRLAKKAEIAPPDSFPLFLALSLIAGVLCQLAFIAAWHKAGIIGVSPTNKVRFTALTADEKSFFCGVIKYTLLLVALVAATAIAFTIASKVFPALGLLVAIGGVLYCLYVLISLYLYLPARAVGETISFKEAARLSRGLGLRILFTLFAAAIPLIFLSMVANGILGGILGVALGGLGSFHQILTFSLALSFLLVFFTMVVIAVSTTVLSRYYVWAVAERPKI